MPYRVLISGSLAYDRIMDFPGRFTDHIMLEKVHALSVSFTVKKMETRFGGNAGNIAYTLKQLGEEPVILSRAGNDFDHYAVWLKKNRISTHSIEIDRARHTAVAHIMTDRDDNQITSFAPGATALPYALTPTARKQLASARLAIIGPSHPEDIMVKCRAFTRAHIPYFADPGQVIPILTPTNILELVRGAEALFGNDYEFELIKQKIKKTRTQLLHMVKFLVVTLGAKGSAIYQGPHIIKIQAILPTKFVDPTGAGDAYRAGFIHGYVRGAPLEVCGKIASLIARLPVAHYGTQEHTLSKADRVRINKLPSPRST